ncbi:Ca(2+)-dependent cysteine protease MCA1 [Sporobolomyces koalae]|uniref:Ca(2+)-dependent cysteine protease MCA1 n=1 Tax=Sporobolomyces koalae TaxID=500713 RepID=UPI00317091B1
MSGYPGAGQQHGRHTVGYPVQSGYAPSYGGGYGGPPPGPPPPQYGGYQPPPPQQQGYNPGYAPPPQQGYNQQMPHPHPQQQPYQAPSQFGGNGQYPQQYSNSSMPVPTHYGNNQQQYQSNAPSQYQGFQMHAAPTGNNAGMYSNMSGKRKALCIGINYVGTSNALAGCHNDARNMSKWLCERQGYKQEDIVMLLDTQDATNMSVPTKANIIRAMQWLCRDARPNDALFFHYSGHGGKTKDLDGDEDDGYDETIYPVDFKQAGEIVDDEMNAIMVQSLPQGCRLTAIFDCCHSGSALDLPYMYSTQGKLKEPNMLKDAGTGALGAISSYARGDLGGVFKSVTSLGSRIMNGDKATQMSKATRSSNADVISWSGCRDKETSADTAMAGQATGAMSWAFITALTKYPQQSYIQLLNTVRDELKGKYDQKPQLSCSHELDVNLMAVF